MNRRTLALLVAVTWVSQAANAQQGASAHEISTFTAANGSFRFSYPSGLQVCAEGKIQPCIYSYIPVCEQDALACVVYPEKEFADTNLGAASFQVREILREGNIPPTNADDCVTPNPNDQPRFLISAQHPAEVIGAVSFIHGTSDGVAAGHAIKQDLYRAFHKQRCFELSVSVTWTNNFEPPLKALSPPQQKQLDETMSTILHSFSFSD